MMKTTSKKSKFGYALGVGLMILGLILLILNAVDYLAGWSVLPEDFTINGIFLATLGLFIAMKCKKWDGMGFGTLRSLLRRSLALRVI